MLRAGEPQPVVHPGIQRGLSAGIDLWLLAGSVAVWAGRRRVVVRCAATLVAGRKIGLAVPGLAVGDVASYISTHVFCLVFEKSEKLRALAVEPAKRLTGADLTARKSHGLKGQLIPEFRLQVWLSSYGRVLRVLFFSLLFGHKARPTRFSP